VGDSLRGGRGRRGRLLDIVRTGRVRGGDASRRWVIKERIFMGMSHGNGELPYKYF
jgi:hypothetical protein